MSSAEVIFLKTLPSYGALVYSFAIRKKYGVRLFFLYTKSNIRAPKGQKDDRVIFAARYTNELSRTWLSFRSTYWSISIIHDLSLENLC